MSATAPPSALLTAREVADYLGMSASWVLDQWQAGELPGYALSTRAVRFRLEEVEEWLAERHRGTYTENVLPGQHPVRDNRPGE
jgi:excisionase family DNA binding protein